MGYQMNDVMKAAERDKRPPRSLMDRLLLDGMDWTDKHPAFGIVGAVLTIIAYGVLEQFT